MAFSEVGLAFSVFRMAYMDFSDGNSFNKALELNGSELNGEYLTVDEAKPRGDSRDGGGSARGGRSGGRSGGWSGGRSGGDGRSGGRFGGRGRGGDRGGRGGRGGRGSFNRPSITASGK